MGNTGEKDLISSQPWILCRGITPNILYVSSFGTLSRGGQISLWNLLSRLDRNKFNPILICAQGGDLLSLSQKIGIPAKIIALPSFRPWNLFSIFISLRRISKIIKEYQINIVHADDLRQILYFGILKIFFRYRLIWHIRVSYRSILFDRTAFYLSEKIICTAKIIVNKFHNLSGYNQKVSIVYNAVDHSYFKPIKSDFGIKERYGIGPQDFVIGNVSRLYPIKGIHFLINAVPEIRRIFKNTKFIIVGDGLKKYRQSLEKRVEELGINESVIFTGFKKDVRPFLHMFDLFIFPTQEKEGSSRSILEAMACGLPVLATDTGGNSELVKNGITGVIIPMPNPMIIAKEAIQLLSQKERLIKMGEEGRKRIIEDFDIYKNVKLIENIYLESIV